MSKAHRATAFVDYVRARRGLMLRVSHPLYFQMLVLLIMRHAKLDLSVLLIYKTHFVRVKFTLLPALLHFSLLSVSIRFLLHL